MYSPLVWCSFITSYVSQTTSKTNIMSFNIRYDEPNDKEQNWHQLERKMCENAYFKNLGYEGFKRYYFSQN